MMDWLRVSTHALWVFGLAILLTTWSYHRWVAQETKQSIREVGTDRSGKIFFAVGMTFVSVGLALISPTWWQSLLWWAWATFSVWKSVALWRTK